MAKYPRTTFGWKLRALWGTLRLDSWGARTGKIISITAVLAFSVGATFFFISVFSKLLALEGIGEPLLWRVIGITLATVFIMLIISNLITGIAAIYKSPEISFMMSRPVPHYKVFIGAFTDNLVYSSWSLAVLGIPLIVAWGWVFSIPFWAIVALVLLGLLPLIVIAAIIAVASLMGLVILAHRTSPRIAVILLCVVVILSIGYMISQRTRGLVVEGRARQSTVQHYLAGLRQENMTPATPPQWMSSSMRALRRGELGRSAFMAGLLILTSFVWLRWLAIIAGKRYYTSWTAFSDLMSRKGVESSLKTARKFNYGWLPNPINALLRKDLTQFRRNPSQWAQFLLLISFLLLYLTNLIWVSNRFDFDNPYWRVLVLFLNFAFTGFILATLSVRFVFPLMSLEGRAFWVVRSAPVRIRLLFWEKFFLAFVVFMGLCELIVFTSNRVLSVSSAMMTLTTTATFLMGATLTGLAIGMGSIMPDFKEESPMRIASTPGGVLTVIISLVYVGLMVTALAWPTEGYFRYLLGRGQFPVERVLRALGLVIGLNLLTLIVPLKLGRQSISKRDF